METLSHPYRPKPWIMALVVAFFGAGAFFMGRVARQNDRGVVINGLIHLDSAGATVFYWCVAGIGAMFVVIGMLAFLVGLFSSSHLMLTATELSLPRFGFSRTATVVKLTDIRQLTTQVVQKERFLNVFHTRGKLTISESMLPSRAAFEALCDAIEKRVNGSAHG